MTPSYTSRNSLVTRSTNVLYVFLVSIGTLLVFPFFLVWTLLTKWMTIGYWFPSHLFKVHVHPQRTNVHFLTIVLTHATLIVAMALSRAILWSNYLYKNDGDVGIHIVLKLLQDTDDVDAMFDRDTENSIKINTWGVYKVAAIMALFLSLLYQIDAGLYHFMLTQTLLVMAQV